jgi:iron complex outermembrane recepter protein
MRRTIQGTASGMILCVLSAMAVAQQPRATDAAADSANSLEEVIVTATKTGSTDLQKTPLAVSAFSAAQLDQLGVANVRDLAAYTPNLNVSQALVNAEIFIRGVGSNNVNAGSDPDVTVQVDGVYIARPDAQFGDYLDVDRVEVLRGPQGTLYGRNAAGGTINVISRQPTDEFHGEEQVTFGNYGLVQEQAYVSGPLVPGSLQGSIDVNYIHHDPYIDNIVADSHGIYDENHGSLRGQLRFEPTDNVVATTRFDWLEVHDYFPYGDQLLAPYLKAPGAPLANSVIGNYSEAAINYPNAERSETGGVSEEINVQLSPDVVLKSISAYRKDNLSLTIDADGTELPLNNGLETQNEDQFSQEFNLNGTVGTLNAVGGVYYFHEDDSQHVQSQAPTAVKSTFPDVVTDSGAIFVQATEHILPDLALTAGVRYTDEQKKFDADFLAYLTPSEHSLPGFPFVSSVTNHYHAATPKFGIDWQIDPDALIYVSATRGYKSGGVNYAATTVAQESFAPEELWSYELGAKTEWFDHRLRANLTGFYYDYSNLQVQSVLGPGTTTISNAASATVKGVEAEFTAKPVPALALTANLSALDATYNSFPVAAVPGALLPFVENSPNYNAKTGTYDASGNYLDNAPRFSASVIAQYTERVSSLGSIYEQAEYSWRDRTYYDPSNANIMSQGAYGLVNLSLGYASLDSHWTGRLFVNNVTDKQYLTLTLASSVVPAGVVGVPRTFGITMGYKW